MALLNSIQPKRSAQYYLEAIDKNLRTIENFISKTDSNYQQAEVLRQLSEKISKAKRLALNFFSTYLTDLKKETPLQALINCYTKERSFKNIVEASDWMIIIDFGIADAGFLIKILLNQERFKRIVLFAGLSHINKLKCLKKMGYVPIAEKGNLSKYEILPIKAPLIKDWLSQIFTEHSETNDIAARSSESSSQHANSLTSHSKLKSCYVCGKIDNLQQCSRCKKIHYCSKVCQRKDWMNHKSVCDK